MKFAVGVGTSELEPFLRPGVAADTEATGGTAADFLAELDLAKKWLGELL